MRFIHLCWILLFLVAVACAQSQEDIEDEEEVETYKPTRRPRPTRRERLDLTRHVRACYKELGLSKTEAYKITRGNLERNDEVAQCFVKCVYMRVGVMNEEGTIDEEKLKKMLPKTVFDPVKVPEWIEQCRDEQGETLCERAFKTYACFLNLAFPDGEVQTKTDKDGKFKSNPFSIDNFARL